jgi:hypothetical protein
VMKKAWEKASPSQRNAVEQYKKENQSKGAALSAAWAGDEMEEDIQQKVTQLEHVLLFVPYLIL